MFLSDSYRTYYKASINVSTTVERGYYKALHTRLSDKILCKSYLIMANLPYLKRNSIGQLYHSNTDSDAVRAQNNLFRQVTKMVTKNNQGPLVPWKIVL